jgi:hypothetical protein
MAYYFYRKYYQQQMLTSQSYYKLTKLSSIDAGNQWWDRRAQDDEHWKVSFYYRMPLKEFNVLYRMRSAHLEGVFDHDKEILVPTKKFGQDGYNVFTPFYYYNQSYLDIFHVETIDGETKPRSISERAAMAVHRGW